MTAPALARTRLPGSARAAVVFGFLAIALQRFGVLVGDGTIQATTVLLGLLVLWALVAARWKIGTYGLILYLCLFTVGICAAVANNGPSYTSLLLFLVTYSLALLAVGDARGLGGQFFSGAMLAVKVGAVLGLIQFAWQSTGRGYLDPFQILPSSIVRTGFNSYYEVSTGSIKPNGMIFLEPSFLSLYTAIGVIYVLTMMFGNESRRTVGNFVWLAVLAGGFAVSASSSGVAVLAIGLLPLLFMMRRRPIALVVVAVSLFIAYQLGVFDSVIAKAGEGWTGRSSAALRLTYPYQYLTPVWLEEPLLGHGPGYATEAIGRVGLEGLQASTLMKLLVEYGLVGAVLVGLIVARAVWRRAPLPIVAAVLAAWLIPGEALLNGTIVMLLLFGIPQWRSRLDASSEEGLGARDVEERDATADLRPSGLRGMAPGRDKTRRA